jgi:hypothetical protein
VLSLLALTPKGLGVALKHESALISSSPLSPGRDGREAPVRAKREERNWQESFSMTKLEYLGFLRHRASSLTS